MDLQPLLSGAVLALLLTFYLLVRRRPALMLTKGKKAPVPGKEELSAIFSTLLGKNECNRVIVIDGEFQSFQLPPSQQAGFIRNTYNDTTEAHEAGPYGFLREVGVLVFERDSSKRSASQYNNNTDDVGSFKLSSAISRHLPVMYQRASCRFTDPETLSPDFCGVTDATRLKMQEAHDSLKIKLPYLRRDRVDALLADPRGADAQKLARGVWKEIVAKRDLWQVMFPKGSDDIRNKLEQIASAPVPAEPAPIAERTVQHILRCAQPVDRAIFDFSRQSNIVPLSWYPKARREAVLRCYDLYRRDAQRRTPGILLGNDASGDDTPVIAFLASLAQALSDQHTAVLVKGTGDLPVLANTCAYYGVPFDLTSVLPRVVDIGHNDAYQFWRATMFDGKLAPNAAQALMLFSACQENPPASPVSAPAAANNSSSGRGIANGSSPQFKLACLLANPAVSSLAPEILALEAAIADSAERVINPSNSAVAQSLRRGTPLSLSSTYGGGIFEPSRAHNPLVDCYFTVVVAALQHAAAVEIRITAARAAVDTALRHKLGGVDRAMGALSAAAISNADAFAEDISSLVADASRAVEELKAAAKAALEMHDATAVFRHAYHPGSGAPAGWDVSRLKAAGAVPPCRNCSPKS